MTFRHLQVFAESRWEGVYKIISPGINVRNDKNMGWEGEKESEEHEGIDKHLPFFCSNSCWKGQ